MHTIGESYCKVEHVNSGIRSAHHSHVSDSIRQLRSHNFCARTSSLPAAEQLAGAQSLQAKTGRVRVPIARGPALVKARGSPVVSAALLPQRRLHGAVDAGLRSLGGGFGEGADDLHGELLRAAQVTPQIRLDDPGVEGVRRHAGAWGKTTNAAPVTVTEGDGRETATGGVRVLPSSFLASERVKRTLASLLWE